jgi:hypothetical protein
MLAALTSPFVLTAIPAGLCYLMFGALLIRQELKAGPHGSPKPKTDPRIFMAMTVTLTGAVFFTLFAVVVAFY